MVFNTLDEIEKEIEILKYLNSKSIDGIILLSSSKEDIGMILVKQYLHH